MGKRWLYFSRCVSFSHRNETREVAFDANEIKGLLLTAKLFLVEAFMSAVVVALTTWPRIVARVRIGRKRRAACAARGEGG